MMNKMMKKIAAALTVATMAIAALTTIASANDGMGVDAMKYASVIDYDVTQTVGCYGANIRMGTSTEAPIITTVAPGTKLHETGVVYQYGKPTEWRRVVLEDGNVGYVNEITFDYMTGTQVEKKTDNKANTNTGKQSNVSLQKYMDTHFAAEAQNESHMTGSYAQVKVDSGYLALRNAPTYDYSNEIEQLKNGDMVEIMGQTSGSYVYVCANSGNFGWVNAGFLF